jgi:hypothetical protein
MSYLGRCPDRGGGGKGKKSLPHNGGRLKGGRNKVT